MTYMHSINKVTPEEAGEIIEIRLPLGKFYCIEDAPRFHPAYVGIDNETGDAWVEEFRSLGACRRWLLKG